METQMAKPVDRKTRAMLKGYEQQLMAARQLARFRVRKMLEANEDWREPDPSISRNRQMRTVSHELYANLLFTGTADSFLETMRRDLSAQLGTELQFAWPPGKSLHLMARENGALRELTKEEWAKLGDLESYTSQKVDREMQKKIV